MLDIRQISKTYANGVSALEGFSLTVQSGEAIAIIGGSGCGKSTLLRLLSGLEQPTGGEIRLEGRILREPDPLINIVFQEPRLFPWLTVADNVGFGLARQPRDDVRRRVTATLERLGIAGLADRWIKELSGGQAQRVALARALINNPAVLLLDEPFSALDAMTREDLQGHLLELWAGTASTLVLVTHDIEEAVLMADRVIVMQPSPGRILQDVRIDLPRPRDRNSPAFVELRRRLSLRLSQSLSGT